MSKVLFAEEVDFANLSFDKPKKLKNSTVAQAKLNYALKEFRIQVPRAKVPFGVSNTPEEYKKDGKDKYTLELSLDTKNPKLAEFKSFLEKFDKYVIGHLARNSKELFGDVSDEASVAKYIYSSVIRFNLDKEKKRSADFPDRFRVKLPIYAGNRANFKVFSSSKEEINFCKKLGDDNYELDLSWGSKGMEVIPIIQCEGLWLINNKAYCSWQVISMIVFGSSGSSVGLDSFRELGDLPTDAAKANGNGHAVAAATVVSEEEDEVEEDEVDDGDEEDSQ